MNTDKWRLKIHLMPPDGWLNDPNGLCRFQEEYHVFFQYSPGEPEGGRKHWGHYISPDLLHWEYVGIALSPEEEFESHGVYSGSAIVRDGKMYVYYTGNVKLQGDYNYITDGRQGNTVLAVSEDGRTFGSKECLLTNAEYPSGLTCHVRDPKVASGADMGIHDGCDYMVLGARTSNDVGEVLLYRSKDLRHWEFVNTISSDEKFGYMWECPDVFLTDGHQILSVSPQGVKTDGINYQNLYQSGYFQVKGDLTGVYDLGSFKEWDRGFDFYAPQTFKDEKGRRLLIGWMGMPDVPEHKNPTVAYGWQNALTVPREIFIKDGCVMQRPTEELESLRAEEQELTSGAVSEELSCYDVEIKVNPAEEFEILISEGIRLFYEKESHVFTLEFDETKDLGCGRGSRSVRIEKCETVRMLLDTSCMEIYLNGGEEVFTSRFYTENGKSYFQVNNPGAKIQFWKLNAPGASLHWPDTLQYSARCRVNSNGE